MEDFEVFEDDEFYTIFVTQSSSNKNMVSLEENMEEISSKSQEYSDVSDAEEDVLEERLR